MDANTATPAFSHADLRQLLLKLSSASDEELRRIHALVLNVQRKRGTFLHDNATVVAFRIAVPEKERLKELAFDRGATTSAVVRTAVKSYIKQHTH